MAYTSITVITTLLIINVSLVLSCPSECNCSTFQTYRNVDCSNRQLTSIPQNFPENTLQVRLERNVISSIANGSFDGLKLPNLDTIYLQHNDISNIQAGAFSELRSLRLLYLNGNDISFITNGSFDGLSRLTTLDLRDNFLINNIQGIFSGLRSLQILHLSNNAISNIADSFNGLTNLTVLNLATNAISNIPSGVFRELRSLQSLYLLKNDISYIANGSFDGLFNLIRLHLHDNVICNTQPGIFDGLTNLTDLRLPANVISKIQPGTFHELRNVRYLDLSENGISYIANGSFDGLSNLAKLYLHNNMISNIQPGIFLGFRRLERLFLYNNVISYIANGSLEYVLPDLRQLRLDGNNLTTLSEGAFPPPTRDIDINFADNPWHCDCNIRWLQYLLLNVTFITTDSSIMCKTPSVHASKVLINIRPPNLMCPAMETTTPNSMDNTTPNSVLPPADNTTPNRMLPPIDTTTPNLILPISIGAGCLSLVIIGVLVFIVIKLQRQLKKRDDNAEGIQGYDDFITSLPRAEPVKVTNYQQEIDHHHYNTIDEDGVTHVVHAQPEHIARGQTNSNNPPGSSNVVYETRITTSI